MKATKWQRAVSLLLCLLMAMSFLTVTAPKAYAADDATAAEVTWAQLTSFKLADESYVYNDYTAKTAILRGRSRVYTLIITLNSSQEQTVVIVPMRERFRSQLSLLSL